MICPNCKKEMQEESNLCTNCGTKLESTCRCLVIKKDNYGCGQDSCPGYGLFLIEKKKQKRLENMQIASEILSVCALIISTLALVIRLLR